MRIRLDGEDVEIPTMTPTPRVIRRGQKMFVFTYDYNYESVPWYAEDAGILRERSGAIVMEASKANADTDQA